MIKSYYYIDGGTNDQQYSKVNCLHVTYLRKNRTYSVTREHNLNDLDSRNIVCTELCGALVL